ncbi:MAG: hypothetical protein J1F20_02510 [Muribaculaceae bacterium]|nr:hypothetical protein [Muribaculaceae bacterium]
MNNDNKRAQIIIKAIESGNDIDTEHLTEALRKPQKSPWEILNLRLLRGCIFSLIGVGLIVSALWILSYAKAHDVEDVFGLIFFGFLSLAIGLSYLIVYFVTRKKNDINGDKK